MSFRFFAALLLLAASYIGCKDSTYDPSVCFQTALIHNAVDKTSEIIVHDIFSPVVAARIYAYASIALYEAIRQDQPDYKSIAGQVSGLTEVPAPSAHSQLDLNLAGVHAYMTVAKALIFSEAEMEEYRTALYSKLKSKGLPEEVFNASITYGNQVAGHILEWASRDNYSQSRSFAKFTVTHDPGRWQPTPPAFIEAIEPEWNKIRPLTLDSSNQYMPPAPIPFSTDKESLFFKHAMEVYHAAKLENKEEQEIANFWDCNPYVMHQQGHLMFATKKITPGGHWMGIVGLATRKAELDMMGTAEAYMLTAIGLFDGFISCWDEKYRSNLIRPETYINRYIDPSWTPTLQTPPFPEHTSGHSVISTASAVILTHLFGDNFAFADSTEIPYDLPVRNFDSFYDAASEAAISRFYGGIHYMPAIDYGVEQGRKVGEHVLARIHTRAN